MDALLMIPGPIEISDRVRDAFFARPPSHVAPHVIEAFGRSLERMREVWCAGAESQPFAVGGSGTMAMEMAVHNVVEPGDAVVLANSGWFSDRMAEMLRRRGAQITEVRAPLGEAPDTAAVAEALERTKAKALFATHVDTSTGVRVDAKALAGVARERGALSVFDGVCATAAERFEMEAWGADVYLTASQKAVGLPVGLALLVASPRALEARAALKTPPAMCIDFEQWQPVMQAYEARRPSYFSTPPTNLLLALDASLDEILATELDGQRGIMARFALHQRVADAMRGAWRALGLELLCRPELAANTLSAVKYPEGVDAGLVGRIKAHGVVVAGGLHPDCKGTYFRVGHMGVATTQPSMLKRTLQAVTEALGDVGYVHNATAAMTHLEDSLAP